MNVYGQAPETTERIREQLYEMYESFKVLHKKLGSVEVTGAVNPSHPPSAPQVKSKKLADTVHATAAIAT